MPGNKEFFLYRKEKSNFIPMSSKIDILLVEDDAGDAGLVTRALKKINLADNIVHVKDGQEALDFLYAEGMSNYPKVVLLDIKLPRVDGVEVLRRLKSNPATRAVPVVMLTSSSECSDINTCYDLGVNSYIVKPVDFDYFVRAVSDIGRYWLHCNEDYCT